MKLKYWLFSLLLAALWGCTGQPATNQASESPMRESTTMAAPSSPAATITPTIAPITAKQAKQTTKVTATRSGTFVSGEHPTQGTVRLITEAGKSFLELDQAFKTSEMGPDLVVILHRSTNVIGTTNPPAYPLKEGDYVFLAPLQKFGGAQRYAIPATIKLADYNSVAIWCRRFNATFGAAKLSR